MNSEDLAILNQCISDIKCLRNMLYYINGHSGVKLVSDSMASTRSIDSSMTPHLMKTVAKLTLDRLKRIDSLNVNYEWTKSRELIDIYQVLISNDLFSDLVEPYYLACKKLNCDLGY